MNNVAILFIELVLAREIDSVRTSLVSRKPVIFKGTDPSKKYFTQCAIISERKGSVEVLKLDSEIIRTEITTIQMKSSRISFMTIFIEIIISSLSIFILFLLYSMVKSRRRKATL